MGSQNDDISYKKMIMIKNCFSNTVLKILHNVARRIKFQIYNQAEGEGGGQN
jgi:hypothetical protein